MSQALLTCTPIGYYYGCQFEKYMAPRQAEWGPEKGSGLIVLSPNCNFEQALEDLEGFQHIWIVYWFDRNQTWNPKVKTPRQGPKRGVFATRSPHRPNPIGLSCVQLQGIKGKEIFIGKNDLLDGTPILDIKPYLAYADSFPDSKQGWIDEFPESNYELHWSPLSDEQVKFIELHQKINLKEVAALRLQENPYPFKNHRIKKTGNDVYQLAVKTWRINYSVNDKTVQIQRISTGYDQETLEGKKESTWNDLPLHLKFLQLFSA